MGRGKGRGRGGKQRTGIGKDTTLAREGTGQTVWKEVLPAIDAGSGQRRRKPHIADSGVLRAIGVLHPLCLKCRARASRATAQPPSEFVCLQRLRRPPHRTAISD